MKSKKLKLVLILSLGFAGIVSIIKELSNDITRLKKNSMKFEREIPADYLSLFNSQVRKDITQQMAASFKLRNALGEIVYKNEYNISMTKASVKSGFNIGKDIIETNKTPNGIPPNQRSDFGEGNFRIIYNCVSNDTISKLYLAIDGDSTSIRYKNDSSIYYYSYLKSADIQYKPEGINEIDITSERNVYFWEQRKPIAIMFICKHGFLYFIALCGRNKSALVSPDMLYNMIAHVSN
jgi:hypothetical protein